MPTPSMTDKPVTGWDTGLCQDYSHALSKWFASRMDARHVLRRWFGEQRKTHDHHPTSRAADFTKRQ